VTHRAEAQTSVEGAQKRKGPWARTTQKAAFQDAAVHVRDLHLAESEYDERPPVGAAARPVDGLSRGQEGALAWR
jgi:hypothetical protein